VIHPLQGQEGAWAGIGAEGQERWLVSLTDLMGLLVAFFVLMFSMTAPEKSRWLSSVAAPGAASAGAADRTGERAAPLRTAFLQALFERVRRDQDALSTVSVSREGHSLVLSVPAEDLFVSRLIDGGVEQNAAAVLLARFAARTDAAIGLRARIAAGEATDARARWRQGLRKADELRGIFLAEGIAEDALTVSARPGSEASTRLEVVLSPAGPGRASGLRGGP